MIGRVLLGREAEAAQLLAAVADSRSGKSSVVVLTGEAGIGKSSLLAYVREHSPDATVLTAVGIEGESDVVYANLADVFRPVYDAIEAIPPRQAAALASVFAIGPSSEADRFTVAAGTLALLEGLASKGPVLVTVDDAQWVDQESMEVLTFVANRLDSEGVVLLFGVRQSYLPTLRLSRFPTLALHGLDGEAARSLIGQVTSRPLADTWVARLIDEAGGNPLALLALPSLLNPEELALWSRGMEPLPIDSLLEEAFCGSVRYLPRRTQDALIVLAILGASSLGVVDAALEACGLGLDDLEPAEQAGLLVDHHGSPEFRHPLVRAAVYQTSTSSRRRKAHLAVAGMIEGSGVSNALERRAWHLVSAGGAADAGVADSLERAAAEERLAGNFAVAGKLFERSGQLTPPGGPAMRRMLQAADSTRLAGAIGEARGLLVTALELGDDPVLRVTIQYFLCRLEMWREGDIQAGRDRLLRLATAVEQVNGPQAAQMLADVALTSLELGDLPTAQSASAHAMDLVAATGQPAPLPVAAIRALVFALGADTDAVRELLDSRTSEIEALNPLATDLTDQLPVVLGLVNLAVENVDRAGDLLRRSVSGARDRSAVGVLPFRLGVLAWVEFWQGRWSAARATAHEAMALAEDTGWASERLNSLAALAKVEALTGRAEESRAHALEVIEVGEQTGALSYVGLARGALGLLDLTLGRYADGVEVLRTVAQFTAETHLTNTPMMWWSGDLVECYVHENRLDEAAAELARLEESVATGGLPTAAAVAARCRALLAPDDFEQHLNEALRWHAEASMPFERARTELQFGSALRRRRRRSEARVHLEAALGRFETLGAVDWAAKARTELEATGVRRAEPQAGLDQLTPQELQVALAVARGLSNREVAAELFLSVKTVEFHLANVFHKLGINRRTRLATIVARQETDGAG